MKHDNPMPDDERDLSSSSKAVGHQEWPEWLQREEDKIRERESADRARIGIAALVILLSGLCAMTAIYNYAGGQG